LKRETTSTNGHFDTIIRTACYWLGIFMGGIAITTAGVAIATATLATVPAESSAITSDFPVSPAEATGLDAFPAVSSLSPSVGRRTAFSTTDCTGRTFTSLCAQFPGTAIQSGSTFGAVVTIGSGGSFTGDDFAVCHCQTGAGINDSHANGVFSSRCRGSGTHRETVD
jgi:hypothetical protein